MKHISLPRNGYGLDTFRIKVIACVCMTIDHIGAFMSNGFAIKYYTLFRIVGRLAAPLFLFILTQSIRYTKNKLNLLKRLYFAGVVVGVSNTMFNFLLGDVVGIHDLGNIIFTYFYVAFYTILIEKIMFAIKQENIYASVKPCGFAMLSLLPCVVYRLVDQVIPTGASIQKRMLIQGVRDSFLPAINHVEYGAGFVILGIVMYFSKKKNLQILVYSIFCTVCICGASIARMNPDIYVGSSFASVYFEQTQCWMVLALPIMMLYNQTRGRMAKGFFYWYYPVHKYIIIVYSALISHSFKLP